MERITISMDDDLARQFDTLIAERGYKNRSEAMRDLVREALEQAHLRRDAAAQCVGALTYVYNHHERELSRRLTSAQHDHHHLTLATLHVHLDHDNCLETAILQGPGGEVRAFAEALTASTGVRHGHLHMVPVAIAAETHHHAEDHEPGHSHLHRHPNS